MWTIFNSNGKAIVNCDFQPNQEDLALRGQVAVYHLEPFSLDEVLLDGDTVRQKPQITLSSLVSGDTATITLACSDNKIAEVPLIIGGVRVLKPIGSFVVQGEPGIQIVIDFERDVFRGNRLEVSF